MNRKACEVYEVIGDYFFKNYRFERKEKNGSR
jgi:hypothetical protein